MFGCLAQTSEAGSDIHRPQAEGGEFEVRYWSPINSPVVDEDGAAFGHEALARKLREIQIGGIDRRPPAIAFLKPITLLTTAIHYSASETSQSSRSSGSRTLEIPGRNRGQEKDDLR